MPYTIYIFLPLYKKVKTPNSTLQRIVLTKQCQQSANTLRQAQNQDDGRVAFDLVESVSSKPLKK